MAFLFPKNDCFTFIWMIENASYCIQKKGEWIESPTFVVNEVQKTKWKLRFYPRGDRNGDYIGLYLNREFDFKGEIRFSGRDSSIIKDNAEIKYYLSFVRPPFSMDLTSHGLIQHSFPEGEGYGYSEFAKREDVFILERLKYLRDDCLCIRCSIWKIHEDMTEKVECFARTRIQVEKRSFRWNVKNFSSFEPGKEATYEIKSLENDSQLMSVNLSLAGGQNCEEMIQFQFTRRDQNISYCSLRLSLEYFFARLECYQGEYWFDKLGDNIQRFNVQISRQKLITAKMLNWPNDTLSLQWKWVFFRGIVSEEIEKVTCGIIISKSSLLLQSKDDEKSLL